MVLGSIDIVVLIFLWERYLSGVAGLRTQYEGPWTAVTAAPTLRPIFTRKLVLINTS